MSNTGAPPSGPVGDFCLPTTGGETACLRDFLASGPLLLWFYRGHW